MTYYVNKRNYFIKSLMEINVNLLKDVTIITSKEEAERLFREANSINPNESVYIPSVFVENGIIFETGLNDYASPITEDSAELHINNYEL